MKQLKSHSSNKVISLKYIIIFISGMITIGLLNIGMEYTQPTEFCVSCHSMQNNLNELEESTHWLSASGVHAGCSDCHVPKAFFPKLKAKILASKDLWYEFVGSIDTPEKFEAKRWEMANKVWKKMKATDSRECRSCHSFNHMDLSEQDRSARNKHEKAIDKGKTCIDCHKGIAHEEPDKPENTGEQEQ